MSKTVMHAFQHQRWKDAPAGEPQQRRHRDPYEKGGAFEEGPCGASCGAARLQLEAITVTGMLQDADVFFPGQVIHWNDGADDAVAGSKSHVVAPLGATTSSIQCTCGSMLFSTR